MNSLWFRFKRGELFKNRHYTPVVEQLNDMNHYIGTKFNRLEIILNYRTMSIDDHITIYKMLNSRYGSCPASLLEVITYVDISNKIVIMHGNRVGLSFKIWINNSPNNYFDSLWKMVYKPLFGNIPKKLMVNKKETDILKLAEHQGNVILHTLTKKDSVVSIDTINNDILTNIDKSNLVMMGDVRLSQNNIRVYEYDVRDSGKWLITNSKHNPNDKTIYSSTVSHFGDCWNTYVGMKHDGK